MTKVKRITKPSLRETTCNCHCEAANGNWRRHIKPLRTYFLYSPHPINLLSLLHAFNSFVRPNPNHHHHTSRRYLPLICRFFTMLSALELSRDPWNFIYQWVWLVMWRKFFWCPVICQIPETQVNVFKKKIVLTQQGIR